MISSKTKIGLLMTGHVVAGLFLAWVTYNGSYMATVGLECNRPSAHSSGENTRDIILDQVAVWV